MTPRVYDFRRQDRPPGPAEKHLSQWLRNASDLASLQLSKTLSLDIELSLDRVARHSVDNVLSGLSEQVVSHRLVIAPSGAGEARALVVWPQSLALTLIGAALGDSVGELKEPRELTAVEESVCSYLLEKALIRPLLTTWPLDCEVKIDLAGKEGGARWTRMFMGCEGLTSCTYVLRGPFGEIPWTVLFPAEWVDTHFRPSDTLPAGRCTPDEAALLKSAVEHVDVEAVARLDTIDLTLSDLRSLRAGDLLLLNRRTSQPLSVYLQGVEKFSVWAGRVGARQAFRIEDVVEPGSRVT